MNIVSEAGAGVVERIDEELSRGTGQASSFHVVEDCFQKGGVFIVGLVELKGAHVEIFEGEVECLCREVSDDVDEVSLVIGSPSLLIV